MKTAGELERVVMLDALRGVFALSVALYHLGVWTRAFEGELRTAVVVAGVYGVEGFFIISGFCFFHLYADTRLDWDELRRFHLKRFFRIAPLYYCAMLLGVAFALDQTVGPRVTPARVVENVTLSFGLIHPNHSMVIGGWSIGLEYVFYLVFPALLWLARSRLVLYLLAVSLALWALPYVFVVVETAAEPRRLHAYVQIPNHAFQFLLGAIGADLRARIALRAAAWWSLPAIALAWWLALRGQAPFSDHLEVMVSMARIRYLALCAFTVLLVAFTRAPAARLLRPFAWLGELSYSVYLMHPFAFFAIDGLVSGLSPLLQVCSGLAATLALAALTRAVIERPSEALGRRLASRPPAAPTWSLGAPIARELAD